MAVVIQRVVNVSSRVVGSGFEVLKTVLSVFVSTITQLGIFTGTFADQLSRYLFLEIRLQEKTDPNSIETRMAEIADELNSSGRRAQSLITEAENLIDQRTRQVEEAQRDMAQLAAEVERTQAELDHLRSIKPEAAAAISNLMDESMDQREKRAGRRDFVILALGSILTGILWVLSEFFLR